MRVRAALAALLTALTLVAAACTNDPPIPQTCTDTDQAGYLRALRAAPGAVRLPGGVPISECSRRVLEDADLQNLGATVHAVAETLASRARAGDATAALQLGYLAAAVDRGAGASGIGAELARRVGTTTVTVRQDRAAARALDRGAAAGAASG